MQMLIDIWPIYTQPSDRRIYTVFFDYCRACFCCTYETTISWWLFSFCSADKICFLCFCTISCPVHGNNHRYEVHSIPISQCNAAIIVKWQTIDLRISFITFHATEITKPFKIVCFVVLCCFSCCCLLESHWFRYAHLTAITAHLQSIPVIVSIEWNEFCENWIQILQISKCTTCIIQCGWYVKWSNVKFYHRMISIPEVLKGRMISILEAFATFFYCYCLQNLQRFLFIRRIKKAVKLKEILN